MARSRKGQAYRIESETPNEAALTAVAAVVRFSDLAMRVIPAFSFAMVLSVRTSSFVHERRVVFVFLANLRILFFFWRTGLLSTDSCDNKARTRQGSEN
jgi:hypothetical protein